jgi:fructose-bisphosphate aldolase, class I
VVPGIKVDTGLEALPGGDPIETWCTGLDGLLGRAQAYYKQGARFCKWRTVLQISTKTPTALCQKEAAWGLARYARTCQEAGLVPIVEPEILMDGDHDLETTARIQEKVLAEVYKYLSENGVYLEGSLLKPSMTVPGADSKKPVKAEVPAAPLLMLICLWNCFAVSFSVMIVGSSVTPVCLLCRTSPR